MTLYLPEETLVVRWQHSRQAIRTQAIIISLSNRLSKVKQEQLGHALTVDPTITDQKNVPNVLEYLSRFGPRGDGHWCSVAVYCLLRPASTRHLNLPSRLIILIDSAGGLSIIFVPMIKPCGGGRLRNR